MQHASLDSSTHGTRKRTTSPRVDRESLLRLEKEKFFFKSHSAEYMQLGDASGSVPATSQSARFVIASLSVLFGREDLRQPIVCGAAAVAHWKRVLL